MIEAPDVEIRRLIEGSVRGDLEAFGQLVQIHQHQAYALALSIVGNHADAEDVSQEAFLKAHKHLKRFHLEGSFKSWLMTIVANQARNRLRWRKVRERFTFSLDGSQEDHEDDLQPEERIADPVPTSDPARQFEQTYHAEHLHGLLRTLPTQQRTAIHLKFIQGYKISEVAQIMELAEGTVKAHIFRGMITLKQLSMAKIEI